jgi:diguanylate cyclase (GGDEF)-like protein
MILIKISRLLIAIAICIVGTANQVYANTNTVVDGETIDSEIPLAQYFTMYMDNSKKLNLHDVISPSISLQFNTPPTNHNLGFIDSAIWLKTTIKNSSDRNKRYYIRHPHSATDYVDFYSSDGNTWDRITIGDSIDFKSRPYNSAQPIFPLNIDANSSKTVVIRILTKGRTNIEFGINNEMSILKKTNDLRIFSGFCFGGVFILLIYNFFRLWGTPSEVTGYYLCLIVSVALYISIESGLSFKYFWPNFSELNNSILLFSLFIICLSWLQFSRKNLSLNLIAPKADRITLYLMWALLVLILTIPILDYSILIIIAWLCSISCMFYLLTLGFIALSPGDKPAKFYLAAITVIIIGSLVFILRNQGVIDSTPASRAIYAICILVGLTLFSLTLSINIQQDNRYKYIDPVTYLFNRVYFFERLENEFEIAFHQQHTLCLLLINIDELTGPDQSKSGFGNNRLIKNAAYQTEQILRKIHIAARFNQDELAVILPNTPAESAKIIAERIRIAIEENTSTTVSIGIACYNSKDRSNIISDHNQLLESTDQAMYRAIKNGGNIVQMYSGDGEESYQGRQSTDPY